MRKDIKSEKSSTADFFDFITSKIFKLCAKG